jgi:hypothetical protein
MSLTRWLARKVAGPAYRRLRDRLSRDVAARLMADLDPSLAGMTRSGLRPDMNSAFASTAWMKTAVTIPRWSLSCSTKSRCYDGT